MKYGFRCKFRNEIFLNIIFNSIVIVKLNACVTFGQDAPAFRDIAQMKKQFILLDQSSNSHQGSVALDAKLILFKFNMVWNSVLLTSVLTVFKGKPNRAFMFPKTSL